MALIRLLPCPCCPRISNLLDHMTSQVLKHFVCTVYINGTSDHKKMWESTLYDVKLRLFWLQGISTQAQKLVFLRLSGCWGSLARFCQRYRILNKDYIANTAYCITCRMMHPCGE